MKPILRVLLAICLIILVSFSNIGCSQKYELSDDENSLLNKLGFDVEVGNIIKNRAAGQFKQMEVLDERLQGLSLEVAPNLRDKVVEDLRPVLLARGYLIFSLDIEMPEQLTAVGIIKGKDKYQILRVLKTNGANYDIDTEALIKKLKTWEKEYPFEIMGANFDWVDIKFNKVPENMASFAQEVYEFCPDSVDQGAGSVEDLANEIKNSERLFLWWD